MSVVRIPNKKKNYSQVSNEVLNDKNLSYEALGLLVHLLGKPNNWKVIVPALIREGKNGETQIYRLLLDLQIAGHLVCEPCRTERGRLCGYHYIAYEALQVVDPAVLKKLVAQRDGQKQRRMINNRRQAAATKRDHPDLDNPDTVHPDLDGRPPKKKEV